MSEKGEEKIDVASESTAVSEEQTFEPQSTAEKVSVSTRELPEASSGGMIPWIIGAVVVVVVLIGSALFLTDSLPGDIDENGPVAIVDGVIITQAELDRQLPQLRNAIITHYGDGLTEEEIEEKALDGIINQTLLLNAARQSGLIVSNEAVQEYIDDLSTQLGGEEVLLEQLEMLGVTYETFENTVQQELLKEEYVVSVVGVDVIDPTPEEVEEQYNELADLTAEGQELPTLESVYDALEQSIKNERFQIAQQDILSELKEDADIDINL